MTDYTPSTEEVRLEYSRTGRRPDREAEFDRWLVEVKTQAYDRALRALSIGPAELLEIRAQAWEEGCRWGAVEFQSLDGKLYDEDKVQVTDADNPYRQGETE